MRYASYRVQVLTDVHLEYFGMEFLLFCERIRWLAYNLSYKLGLKYYCAQCTMHFMYIIKKNYIIVPIAFCYITSLFVWVTKGPACQAKGCFPNPS